MNLSKEFRVFHEKEPEAAKAAALTFCPSWIHAVIEERRNIRREWTIGDGELDPCITEDQLEIIMSKEIPGYDRAMCTLERVQELVLWSGTDGSFTPEHRIPCMVESGDEPDADLMAMW